MQNSTLLVSPNDKFAVMFKSNKFLRNIFIQHEIYFIQNRGAKYVMSTSPKIMPTSDYMISAKKGALFAKKYFCSLFGPNSLGKMAQRGEGSH